MKTKAKSRHGAGPGSSSVRISVSFPKEQYELLSRIAHEKKVSVAWVARDAAEQYLAQRWPLLGQVQGEPR